MVYTEIQEKKGKKYYYRVLSIRKNNKVTKNRIYLGVDLEKNKLSKKEKKADKELMLLSTLLEEEELKELDKIKKEYLKLPKETRDNRYEAFDFIIENKKDVSKELILKLHKLVVKNTLKPELKNQIGKYRTLQVYIRGTNWFPPKSTEVPKEIASLLSWYTKNKKKLHPLILAAYFHSAFETVHPFVDGNGRVGRLILNLILRKNNFPMINIPNKKKYIYYEALESAQTKGDLRPLVKFLLDLIKEEQIRF